MNDGLEWIDFDAVLKKADQELEDNECVLSEITHIAPRSRKQIIETYLRSLNNAD